MHCRRQTERFFFTLHSFLSLCLCFSVVSLLPDVRAQAPQKPWTKDQIIRLLKGDVSPTRVAVLARQRGIDFQITSETETELRQAGATAALLTTLRELAPKPPAPPPPPTLVIQTTPGNAQVFVDDKLLGQTDAAGRLRLSQVQPGEHRVRLALAGYQDNQQTVVLAVAQQAQVTAKLEAVRPVAVAPPAATNFRVAISRSGLMGHKGCWGNISIESAAIHFECDDKSNSTTFGSTAIRQIKIDHNSTVQIHLKTGQTYEFTPPKDGTPLGEIVHAFERAMGRP